MKTLKSATKNEVQLLMDFDYNNVLGRIKYVLGKEASLFSDILIKNSEIHWMVRDESEYISLTELSVDVQSEVKGTLSGRLSYVLGVISGDSLIGAHSDKILSYPSDDYIYVKEGKSNGDVIITGWGCKSLLQDTQCTTEIKEDPLVEEPKEVPGNSEPTDARINKNDSIEDSSIIEDDNISSIDEPIQENTEAKTNESVISEDSLEKDELGEPKYTSEWLKSNTDIHGWLSFFFFAILLGGLISAISNRYL